MRSDKRTEDTRFPTIDLGSFLYRNYKDIIAFLLIIFCVFVFVFSKDCRESEKVSTILTMIISGSLGFVFGKKTT
jgi:TctA family transporter